VSAGITPLGVVPAVWQARAMRSRLLRAALAMAAVVLTAPAAAHATLVYSKFSNRSATVYVANDDGTGARKLAGNADHPRISPDGQSVAYVSHPFSDTPEVQVVSVAGGAPQQLVDRWAFGILSWSPDSTHLVANAGGFRHQQRLRLVDVAAGTARTIARGFFTNASFSPDGSQLVYDVTAKQDVFEDVDLHVAPVAGGASRALTTDGHSLHPLWGPSKIAYTRYAKAKRRHPEQDSPKYNLSLIDPTTGHSSKLTNDTVPYLLAGLTPAAWSLDGTELVASFGGQDTTYAVTVDPVTGKEAIVGKKTQGIIPSSITKDGRTILGQTSYVESANGTIITVPYAGGATTVLVKHAGEPDWTR
jgi:Tol biopolymer transport system component